MRMSSAIYYFKTAEPEFFVQCQWKKDIDFTKEQDYTVSLVTLTDTVNYWQMKGDFDAHSSIYLFLYANC